MLLFVFFVYLVPKIVNKDELLDLPNCKFCVYFYIYGIVHLNLEVMLSR